MKNLFKCLLFFIVITSKCFAIGAYKKGDVLYNWNDKGINVQQIPAATSEVLTVLYFGEKCLVIDEKIKSKKFYVQEIAPFSKQVSANEELNFTGFKIHGFWVQIRTKSGEIGYVFDGNLSKLKPDFELTKSHFDSKFKLTKSTIKKFPKPNTDEQYLRNYAYKNGNFIKEIGSNYDSHSHYFIPNLTIEEGYWLALKTHPDVLELHKSSGDAYTTYQYEFNKLSFSTSLEAVSISKTKLKGINGIELIFEAWD